MAKRRVNKPLLIGLSIGVALAAALAVVVVFKWLPKDPGPYIEHGDSLLADGDLLKAAEDYAKAWAYDKSKARETWGIQAGDIYWALGLEGHARTYYQHVVKAQPESPRALERLVHLTFYIANLGVAGQDAWLQTLDAAENLMMVAGDNPLGYEVAAIAHVHLNRKAQGDKPDDQVVATELLDKLVKMDPNNPSARYWSAATMVQPRDMASLKTNSTTQADSLMAFVPKDAPEAVVSRFRLYQLEYLNLKTMIDSVGLGTEARHARFEDLIKALRAGLAGVKDVSRMTRWEQMQLAELAKRAGDRSLAEKILLGWKNDQLAELAMLADPPVQPRLMERVMAQQPTSLASCLEMVALHEGQGHVAEVCTYADLAAAVPPPVVTGSGPSLLNRYTRRAQCNVQVIKVRLLVQASASQPATQGEEAFDHARAEYEKVGTTYREFLEDTGGNPELAAHYLQVGGLIARRTRDYPIAVIKLKSAVEALEQARLNASRPFEYLPVVLDLIGDYRSLRQPGLARDKMDNYVLNNQIFKDDPRVVMLDAELYADVNDFTEALRRVDRLLAMPQIKDSPLFKPAADLKATVLRQSGQWPQWVAFMATVDPDSAAQRCREGILAMFQKTKDHDTDPEAIAKFEAALQKDGASWEAVKGLYVIYQRQGAESKDDAGKATHKAQAEKVLQDFIDANEKTNPQLTLAAKVRLKASQSGREVAQKLLVELLQANETPYGKEVRLLDEAARAKNGAEVAQHLKAAGDLVPPALKNHFLTVAFDAMLRTDNLVEARKCYEDLKLRGVDGVNGDSYLGQLLLAEHKYDEAIATLTRVLKVRSDSVSRRLLALAKFESNKSTLEEVDGELNQAIHDDPTDRDAWYALVQIYLRNGRVKEAGAAAERGLQRLVNDPYLQRVRLEGLAMTDLGKAVTEREQIAKDHPEDISNALVLARLYYAGGNLSKMDGLLGKIADQIPALSASQALAATAVANQYFDAHDAQMRDKGHSVLEAYVQRKPDDPEGHAAMGDYLRRMGKMPEAEKQYLELNRLTKPDPVAGKVQVQKKLAGFYHDWEKKEQCLAALDEAARLAGKPDFELLTLRVSYQVDFGQLAEANAALAEVHKLAPDDPGVTMLEGYIQMRFGKWDQALEIFNAVLAKRPDMAVAYYRRGMLLYRLNPGANLNKAITDLESALRYSPRLLDGQPCRELAELYMQRTDDPDRVAKALGRLRTQLEAQPDDAQARLQAIRVLDYAKMDRDLDSELQRAMTLFPDAAEFPVEAGRVALRRKQYRQAEDFFRTALRLAPKSELVAIRLSAALAEQNKWQEILDGSDQWLKPANVGESTEIYLERARAFTQLKKTPEMLAALGKAVDASNGQPALLLRLALRLADKTMMGPDVAEQWLTDFIKTHADAVPFQLMRAHFWALNKQVERALAECARLAKLYPDGPNGADVRFNTAIILQQAKRYKEAADQFEQVMNIAKERTSYVVLNNYAYLLGDSADEADRAKAIDLAEHAVSKTNRADPQVLDTLGWCYIRAGKTAAGVDARKIQQGLDVLEEARQTVAKFQREEMPIIYYHMAEGYQRLDRLDEARKWVRKAAELAEKDPEMTDDTKEGIRKLNKDLTAGG